MKTLRNVLLTAALAALATPGCRRDGTREPQPSPLPVSALATVAAPSSGPASSTGSTPEGAGVPLDGLGRDGGPIDGGTGGLGPTRDAGTMPR